MRTSGRTGQLGNRRVPSHHRLEENGSLSAGRPKRRLFPERKAQSELVCGAAAAVSLCFVSPRLRHERPPWMPGCPPSHLQCNQREEGSAPLPTASASDRSHVAFPCTSRCPEVSHTPEPRRAWQAFSSFWVAACCWNYQTKT